MVLLPSLATHGEMNMIQRQQPSFRRTHFAGEYCSLIQNLVNLSQDTVDGSQSPTGGVLEFGIISNLL